MWKNIHFDKCLSLFTSELLADYIITQLLRNSYFRNTYISLSLFFPALWILGHTMTMGKKNITLHLFPDWFFFFPHFVSHLIILLYIWKSKVCAESAGKPISKANELECRDKSFWLGWVELYLTRRALYNISLNLN